MSNSALTWAFNQPTKTSSAKLVLLTLADMANKETGLAFPCTEKICRLTHLNRKTVLGAIQALIHLGLIHDTGKRVGETNSVRVFRLNLSDTENGIAKRSRFYHEAVPILPDSGPKNGMTHNIEEPELTRRNHPQRYASTILKEMDHAKSERERLFRKSAIENSITGTSWRNEDDRNSYRRLGERIKALKTELNSQD